MGLALTFALLCGFISIPTVVSTCSFIDEANLFFIGSNLLACLDIDQSELPDLLEEIDELRGFNITEIQREFEVCRDIECEEEETICLDRVVCVNDVLSSLDDQDMSDDYTPSENLLKVLFSYCECYTILEDINLDCEEYIDEMIGFHVPIEEMIEAGDTYCTQVEVACSEIDVFLDECVSLEDTTVEALCDEYEAVILSGDTSDDEALCAAEVMTIVLLPDYTISATETMCNLDSTEVDLLNELRETCDFQVSPYPTIAVIPDATPQPTTRPTIHFTFNPSQQPTAGPTAQDAVSIELEFGFAVSDDSLSTEELGGLVKPTLASELDILEKDLRSFALVDSTIRLRSLLTSYSYIVTTTVMSSLQITSATSETELAQSFVSVLSSSEFESSLSVSIGSSTTVTSSTVRPSVTTSPTALPTLDRPSSKVKDDDGEDNGAVVGAALTVTFVVIFIGLGVSWLIYKKKEGKWGSYMATDEDMEEVEMSSSSQQPSRQVVMNPTLATSEESVDIINGGDFKPLTPTSDDEPKEKVFESDGNTAWF